MGADLGIAETDRESSLSFRPAAEVASSMEHHGSLPFRDPLGAESVEQAVPLGVCRSAAAQRLGR